jgi:hypothetical protein
MDAYPASARDDAVMSDQWSASPPSPSALCGYPHHCAAIPVAVGARDDKTSPSPPLYASSLPSATPSSRRTDGDSSGRRPHNHPRSRSWAGTGLATTPARSGIHQDDQQLHGTVHHTVICSLELCGTIVNRLPLVYKRRARSPGCWRTTDSCILAHFPPSPRYWHSASIKPQGPGGLSSSPATLVAPLCKHYVATQYSA